MVVITTHPADSPGDESVRSLDRKSILIGGIIIVIIEGKGLLDVQNQFIWFIVSYR